VIVHQPVLPEEVLSRLVPPATGDALLIDATLGQGGHTEAFLSRYPRLVVIAVDADRAVMATARERLSGFAGRIQFVHSWFGDFLERYAADRSARAANLVLFDLGISRFHYDGSSRGFSFERDEPLDMRLDPSLPASAADLVNGETRQELTRILREYGEERYAWEIAGKIVRERQNVPLATSSALARLIAGAVPPEYRRGRIHPATKSFQALRIAVNGELAQLERGLSAALAVLCPGGRIGVISFHSLEDRIVKRFFRDRAKGCTCPPDWPICQCGGKAELRVLTSKPVRPTPEEMERNPASRSAKLRVAEKGAA
jgi:16S rRNA (cytosine1402-N4)-methyltransferase